MSSLARTGLAMLLQYGPRNLPQCLPYINKRMTTRNFPFRGAKKLAVIDVRNFTFFLESKPPSPTGT